MLTSLAVIFILALLLGSVFEKLKLPRLMGMLLAGIILGPYTLNLLDKNLLAIAPDLRQLALVVILTRAGLALDIKELRKVGRPAILMCFIPATFEILGVMLLAPKLLHVSLLEAAIMGTVLAAVSPAVIVPRMLKLIKNGYGTKASIPQLIMAGASVDDIFVIVLFTSFTSLAQGGEFGVGALIGIPVAIVLGIVVGMIGGKLLGLFFKNYHLRDSVKVLILLSISFLLITLENVLKGTIPVSGLLGIMSMGATLLKERPVVAKRLSEKFAKVWVAAEILLFVLVGATIDIKLVIVAGAAGIVVILGALLWRVIGVLCCLIKTNFTKKERIFCAVAYLPKATVQAAIGTIPLSMGLPCGEIVLVMAVLGIVITAPLGAIGIDRSYKKLLSKEIK